MDEKITVIVPVYKVENYLEKCVKSILRQTYKNLEVILIDDGSPDSCGAICDRFAASDRRVRCIHKKNEGVAAARNTGLDAATGDYISFVDSDDWISKDAYKTLMDGLNKYGADCAVGGCVTVVEKNGALRAKKNPPDRPVKCMTAKKAVKNLLLDGSAIWNRLFKAEVFKEIRFPTGRVNDDEVVALHAYAKCKKIVFLNTDTYFYRIRQNSITTSGFSLRNVDCYYNSVDNLSFVKDEFPSLIEEAEFKRIKAMLYAYVNLARLKDDKKAAKIRKSIKKDIKKSLRPAISNRYVTAPMKLLALVCAL